MPVTICEACGQPCDLTKPFGVMDIMELCVACAEVVDGYLKRRDVIHESVARSFAARVEELRLEFESEHPGIHIPDN